MRKEIDILSKNLASGMSRRKALLNFLAGFGAVGALGVLTSKKARANGVEYICEDICATKMQLILTCCNEAVANSNPKQLVCNVVATDYYDACIASAAHCPDGTCPGFQIAGKDPGVGCAAFDAFIVGAGGFVCIPVLGGIF